MITVPPKSTERSPEEELLIDVDGTDIAPPTEAPSFGPAPASAGQTLRSETRRVAIPPHRMSPLKRDWINIFGPLTEILGLQIRMNVRRKCVEMRVRLLLLLFLSHYRDSYRIDLETHKRNGRASKGGRFRQGIFSWFRCQRGWGSIMTFHS